MKKKLSGIVKIKKESHEDKMIIYLSQINAMRF